MNGIIYMWTSPDGKSYIGKTFNEDRRIYDHRSCNGSAPFLHKAIKELGWKNFKYEILHSGIQSKDELSKLELEEISSRDTVSPKGYNIINFEYSNFSIANKSGGRKRKVICIDTGECFDSAIEAATWGNTKSTLVVGVCRGRNVSTNGFRFCYLEDFDKYQKCNHGKKNVQKVRCIETGVIYASIRQASKETGARSAGICDCINGKSKTSGGYTWEIYGGTNA